MEKSRQKKKPQEPHKQWLSGLFTSYEPEGIRTPDTQLRKLGTNGLTMRFLGEGATVGVTVGTKKGEVYASLFSSNHSFIFLAEPQARPSEFAIHRQPCHLLHLLDCCHGLVTVHAVNSEVSIQDPVKDPLDSLDLSFEARVGLDPVPLDIPATFRQLWKIARITDYHRLAEEVMFCLAPPDQSL